MNNIKNKKKNRNNQDFLKENMQSSKDCIDGIKIRQLSDKITKNNDIEKYIYNLIINDEHIMLIPEDRIIKEEPKDF